jgi:hypothetical protein
MSRRAILNIAMMVFTLASSLGESLHALPELGHHDDSAVCQVRTDHMEAPPEEHHDDCPVCQSAVPFQATVPQPLCSMTFEQTEFRHVRIAEVRISFRFESLTARAPPLG